MVKIQRRIHFGIFPKITVFFLLPISIANKFKIDLVLDLSKSKFADFNILAKLF